ncbi:MAG: MFS transporter [Chloroflexi bacterium]|nr:MFS transporter [Chloroflexota bacterium]
MDRRFFYGWVIVVTLFMVNFATMATGTLNFGLFVLPMSDDLGMSRGFIGWSQTTRMLAGGVSGFILGRLLDRHGPRVLIAVASLTTGACMVGLVYIQDAWQFLLLFSVMGLIGLSAPGGLLTSVPVAKWFVRQRGKALAMATMGLGVGGIAFMPVTQVLIDEVGWRGTWLVLAIVSVTLTVPLAVLLLRRQPEDMGLNPDGAPTELPQLSQRLASREDHQWTASQALHTRTFWRLILFFGLLGFAAGGGSIHRLPYWVEQGFDPKLVSYAFSADAAGAALMALTAGFLVDRFPVRFVALASCLGFITAIGLMLIASTAFYLFASTILFGLSVGANMIVTSFVWADYYGRTFLGTIRGIVLPATLVTAGAGAPIAGYIYDAGGSYKPVWWILIMLYALAALVIINTKAPQPLKPQGDITPNPD